MKNHLLIIIISLTIVSCSKKNSQKIEVPDIIKIEKVSDKIKVPGTRILVNHSDSYQYIDELTRFQKSENNYFQIFEIPNGNYDQSIPSIISKIQELKNSGGNVLIDKKLKLGEYNAYFGIAPQNNNFDQIILAFGDESFAVIIAGKCPSNYVDRKKMTELILSSYLDKKTKANPEEKLLYNIDVDNSDFKLNQAISGIGIYTLNGKEIDDYDPTSHFIIQTLPKDTNFNMEVYSDDLIFKAKNSLFEHKKKKIRLISSKAETNKLTREFNGSDSKSFKLIHYLKKDPKRNLIFVGIDYSNNSKYLDYYKKICQKIELK
jgi:hypothetical protein